MPEVYIARVTSPKGAKTIIFSRFVRPLIYISHPPSQGPRPGPGAGPGPGPGPAKKDGKCVFFFKRVCKPLLLREFVRNSSFTRQVDLIIGSSRSGTCFSSCLASSTYFSITKKYVFYRVNMFLCPGTHRDHSLTPISGPCSIEKYPSLRMANRYTRIFDAG